MDRRLEQNKKAGGSGEMSFDALHAQATRSDRPPEIWTDKDTKLLALYRRKMAGKMDTAQEELDANSKYKRIYNRKDNGESARNSVKKSYNEAKEAREYVEGMGETIKLSGGKQKRIVSATGVAKALNERTGSNVSSQDLRDGMAADQTAVRYGQQRPKLTEEQARGFKALAERKDQRPGQEGMLLPRGESLQYNSPNTVRNKLQTLQRQGKLDPGQEKVQMMGRELGEVSSESEDSTDRKYNELE
jgi:hypothetical protein